MVERGSFFCCFYGLNDPHAVASRIFREENLPNFTSITGKDKSYINVARYNLFSLLMPIHDREVGLGEFVQVANEWNKKIGESFEVDFENFYKSYLGISVRQNYIKRYTE